MTRATPSIQWLGTIPVPDRRLLFVDPMNIDSGGGRVEADFPADTAHVGISRAEEGIARLWLTITPDDPTVVRTRLGYVPVDLACLVVCSPSFLPHWMPEDRQTARCGDTFVDRQGTHWYCAIHPPPPPAWRGRPFPVFTAPLPELDGLSINDALERGVVERHRYSINADEFSEAGAFATRTGPGQAGFLRHDGQVIAFACKSGRGDGNYPVRACMTPGGQGACVTFLAD